MRAPADHDDRSGLAMASVPAGIAEPVVPRTVEIILTGRGQADAVRPGDFPERQPSDCRATGAAVLPRSVIPPRNGEQCRGDRYRRTGAAVSNLPLTFRHQLLGVSLPRLGGVGPRPIPATRGRETAASVTGALPSSPFANFSFCTRTGHLPRNACASASAPRRSCAIDHDGIGLTNLPSSMTGSPEYWPTNPNITSTQ
jgi:hypothetical protein